MITLRKLCIVVARLDPCSGTDKSCSFIWGTRTWPRLTDSGSRRAQRAKKNISRPRAGQPGQARHVAAQALGGRTIVGQTRCWLSSRRVRWADPKAKKREKIGSRNGTGGFWTGTTVSILKKWNQNRTDKGLVPVRYGIGEPGDPAWFGFSFHGSVSACRFELEPWSGVVVASLCVRDLHNKNMHEHYDCLTRTLKF